MAIATINPATGKTLKTFEPLSSQEIERKISRAAKLFPEFSRLSFAERATMMLKAAEILEVEKKELAQLMTMEMGKTLRSAVDEAVKCAWACRYYADNAERFLADEVIQTTATRSFVRYQPLGARSRGHAVELSILAGLPVYRARAHGRKRWFAEARLKCPPMRA